MFKKGKSVKSENISFKVTLEFKNKIQNSADKENRSMASFITNVLDKYIKENYNFDNSSKI